VLRHRGRRGIAVAELDGGEDASVAGLVARDEPAERRGTAGSKSRLLRLQRLHEQHAGRADHERQHFAVAGGRDCEVHVIAGRDASFRVGELVHRRSYGGDVFRRRTLGRKARELDLDALASFEKSIEE
jgi:hypothetical protein